MNLRFQKLELECSGLFFHVWASDFFPTHNMFNLEQRFLKRG